MKESLKMKKKLLFVTFPVDLGNSTFEHRFINLFDDSSIDLEVHRFMPNQKSPTSFYEFCIVVWKRFLGSFELQKKIRQANREGRSILFHGISPALFAYPATKRDSSCIVTDWTRKLYEPIYDKTISPAWLTFIHKQVLNSQKYVIGLTDAVVEEISKDYGIPNNKLKKGRLPFSIDLELFSPSPNRNDEITRILFVGGDFQRKGGDTLLDWFEKHQSPNLQMTMITNYQPIKNNNVAIENNIQYGESKHVELFKSHDIFVLPTKCDSYPSVIGEAACAGLAVLTTKYALGAPEIIKNGVNGYICDSQEELLDRLSELIQNKNLIKSMKKNSHQIMEDSFDRDAIFNDYTNFVF
jgi:glycosyltransferase involved in cell wall biosynthesis